MKSANFIKTAIPHVETMGGDFLDLTLEKLPEDQRIHYLRNFVKGKFTINGISFNDVIEEDKGRLLYYLHSMENANLSNT